MGAGAVGVVAGLCVSAGARRKAFGARVFQCRHRTGRGRSAKAAAGRLLFFLRLLAVGLGIVALSGPRFANDRTETQASGVDIMLALDLSWSMMALDMSGPNERVTRFDIARKVLEDFIRKREHDRIGLVVFSAVPYLASPLTLNHDWLCGELAAVAHRHDPGIGHGDWRCDGLGGEAFEGDAG